MNAIVTIPILQKAVSLQHYKSLHTRSIQSDIYCVLMDIIYKLVGTTLS